MAVVRFSRDMLIPTGPRDETCRWVESDHPARKKLLRSWRIYLPSDQRRHGFGVRQREPLPAQAGGNTSRATFRGPRSSFSSRKFSSLSPSSAATASIPWGSPFVRSGQRSGATGEQGAVVFGRRSGALSGTMTGAQRGGGLFVDLDAVQQSGRAGTGQRQHTGADLGAGDRLRPHNLGPPSQGMNCRSSQRAIFGAAHKRRHPAGPTLRSPQCAVAASRASLRRAQQRRDAQGITTVYA